MKPEEVKNIESENIEVSHNYLTKITAKIQKYNIFAFDIETYSSYNLFLMGSLVGDNFKKVFWNKDSFIKHLLSLSSKNNQNRIAIYATNLQFDLLALFEDSEYFDNLYFITRGSDIIGAKLFCDNERYVLFLDTMNIAHFSVEKLGEILNQLYKTKEHSKLSKPSCLAEIPLTEKDFEELETYNVQDSVISQKFASFTQKALNELGCELKMTLPSTAVDLFRRKYLKEQLLQPPKEYLDLFYNAYYGGRTEIFKRGYVENLHYYDFNSLYPAQYFKPYPHPNYFKYKNSNIIESDLNFEGICEVDISTPSKDKMNIPFLPWRDIKLGKLIFPCGKFHGWYTNLELREAIKRRYKITKYYQMIYYTQTISLFKEYGEELYNLRLHYKKEKNPYEIVIKLLLNSLYGKFAQKYYNTETINLNNITMDELNEHFKNENADFVIAGNFGYLTKYDCEIPRFINPIISIYITAYARLQLYEMFEKIGFDKIYYCDTDSIITSEKIKTSDKLGDLKLEYEIKHGILIKPKFYGFITQEGEEVVKSKGVPVFYHTKNKYDLFIKTLYDPKITYMKFTKFRESNRSQEHHKFGKLKYNEKHDVTKVITLKDDKRIWNSDKFDFNELQTSIPLTITESDIIDNN